MQCKAKNPKTFGAFEWDGTIETQQKIKKACGYKVEISDPGVDPSVYLTNEHSANILIPVDSFIVYDKSINLVSFYSYTRFHELYEIVK